MIVFLVLHVLTSDLAQQKQIHWLKVVLVGTKSNRNGLGAAVRLHAGSSTYTRYNDGKSRNQLFFGMDLIYKF